MGDRMINDTLKNEIITFIKANVQEWASLAREYGDCTQITIGCDGEKWGFQTGDTSFWGGAYGFAHWGIGYVSDDDGNEQSGEEIALNIIDQLEEDMAECLDARCRKHDS